MDGEYDNAGNTHEQRRCNVARDIGASAASCCNDNRYRARDKEWVISLSFEWPWRKTHRQRPTPPLLLRRMRPTSGAGTTRPILQSAIGTKARLPTPLLNDLVKAPWLDQIRLSV